MSGRPTSFDAVDRTVFRPVLRPVGRNATPSTRQCPGARAARDAGDIIANKDRAAAPEQHRSPHRAHEPAPAAAILRHDGGGEGRLHVGRKPAAAGSPQSRDRLFGAAELRSGTAPTGTASSPQRHRTHGDIVAHRDGGATGGTAAQGGRGRVAAAPAQGSSLSGGVTTRTDAPAPASPSARARGGCGGGTGTSAPFATDRTAPAPAPAKARHANHYDHGAGVLGGGDMRSTQQKSGTPLWY